MTVELIEFIVGLYFIGRSISITRTAGSPTWTKSVDAFKLVFGVVLLVIALYHGVRI
jgi:hypothetical protein